MKQRIGKDRDRVTMISRLRITVIALLALGLVIGFVWLGQAWLALSAAVLGLLWLVGGWRANTERPLLDLLGLVGFCGLAADGVVQGLAGWLGLLAVLLALAGWDLSRFERRLAEAAPVSAAPLPPAAEDEAPAPPEAVVSAEEPAASPAARMQRTHLTRLGLALGGGLLLGGAALLVRIPLEFGAALAVGLVAIIALSRVVRGVNR
jgi:hypothetical protein